MDDLKEIADRIVGLASKGHEPPVFLGPIPEARLENAERELGVKFTGSYRAYLLHLGAAIMLDHVFYGLPDHPQPEDDDYHYINIVDNTIYYRNFAEYLPCSCVSVTDNGGWVTFWMDTAIVEKGESPVVAYAYDKRVKIASSFLGFVELLTHREKLYELFR